MKFKLSPASRAVALVFAGVLASAPAWAEKGGHGGGGGERGNAGQKHEKDDDRGADRGRNVERNEAPRADERHGTVVNPAVRFSPEHRTYVSHYYDEQFRSGNCPPGLAKKHNGCMPPGQAKKWVTGQPLPAGVVTYPVPQPLLVQLGTPPAGYRYVRVGNDIVLLSPGTSAVVDVIRNLGRG